MEFVRCDETTEWEEGREKTAWSGTLCERSQLGADVQEVFRAFTHVKVAISGCKDTKVLKFVFSMPGKDTNRSNLL